MQKIKTVLLLLAAMIATTLGDIFMSKLMRPYENINIDGASAVKEMILQILCTPVFWVAVTCFIVFLSLWLYVLSYEDLSFALPMTATTYIFNALLAGPVLGEHISAQRWMGTVIIGFGVLLTALSKGKAEDTEGKTEENGGSSADTEADTKPAPQAGAGSDGA